MRHPGLILGDFSVAACVMPPIFAQNEEFFEHAEKCFFIHSQAFAQHSLVVRQRGLGDIVQVQRAPVGPLFFQGQMGRVQLVVSRMEWVMVHDGSGLGLLIMNGNG